MKKSIAILGLGKYGMSLARALHEMGADVLAADLDEKKVREIADDCTKAVCADLADEEQVKALDLKNMDIVVAAMGRSLEASIISVSVAKELHVPLIVAKSSSERMSSILKKVGADKVIIPEEYAGMRSARILISESVLDYFQVDASLCMIEINPPEKWAGHSLIDLDLRKKYRLNVVAQKEGGGPWMLVDPGRPLARGCRLLIMLEKDMLKKLRLG